MKTRSGKAIVQLQGLSKILGGKTLLNHIDLSLFENEAVAVIGKNGAGKSTLLNVIAGMTAFDSGVRTIEDSAKFHLGYVPDKFPALKLRAMDFLLSVGKIKQKDTKTLKNRIKSLADLFDMTKDLDTLLHNMSKGMLQKINIMQALLHEPKILILDEPLSGLDKDMQIQLIKSLKELKKEGKTLLLTSHEPEIIERLADRIIYLKQGQIELEEYKQNHSSHSFVRAEFTTQHLGSSIQHNESLIKMNMAHRYQITISLLEREDFLMQLLLNGGVLHRIEEFGRLEEK